MKEDIDILLITGGTPDNKSIATSIDKLLKILLNIETVQQSKNGRKRKASRALNPKRRNIFSAKSNCGTASITDNIHLVTFCNNELISSLNNENLHFLKWYKNRFKRFLFLYRQILVSKVIFSISRTKDIKIVLFAFGQDLQLLPMIISKIVAKKTIIRSDGRPTIVQKKYFKTISVIERYFYKIIEEINYRLADIILTECEYMILENNFQKYNSHNGSLFVDINRFIKKTYLYNRRYDIGFVGRLHREKGILNFLKALELLDEDFNVVIIGDGEEKDGVLSEIGLLKSISKLNIMYIDWVEHSKLPSYLNKIKLLAIPSYKEGLPNIVLESMACGCVVLSTPVGGIPGVIKDGETGFIMENNTPECIAENVMRALEHPNPERIVENARALVKREFTYEVAVERYRKILENI